MKNIKKDFGLNEIRVHMGLFDFTVVCVIGNKKKADEYVAWKFDDKELPNFDQGYETIGRCYFKRGYVPVIWIPRKPKTTREHATLAHECLHAVFHLFDWVGLRVTRDTEEVMTHSMAHLIDSILRGKKTKSC